MEIQPIIDLWFARSIYPGNTNAVSSIRIPWSTDPSIKKDGQDANHLNWEAATLQVLLDIEAKVFF
jgi:hypothetical protein